MIFKITIAILLAFPQFVWAITAIDVGNNEAGTKSTGQAEIWHDEKADHSLAEVIKLYQQGEFKPLHTAGSTGLKPGAFWSHVTLRNVTDQTLRLEIEYIDHQLIELDAFSRLPATDEQYQQIASLSLHDSFDERPVAHNRFVLQLSIPPHQLTELLVKFSSHQAGFVFPSMRIWSPDNLRETHTAETSIIMFLFGGVFVMAIFSLVGAIATHDKTFFSYSIYALTKIVGWFTILGYTHQFIIKEHFDQSYMSVSGALGILCGIVFSRLFLQTRRYTPKLDYILILMIGNSVFLLITAFFGMTGLSVLSITIALLLYPMLCVAGIVRWRQGSKDAAVFAVAWSLLVFGMVGQALRDLGMVEHNFINYYWPAFASFVEMLGIMAAMGIKVRRLRLQKDNAEHRYLEHLEHSKAELEIQVQQRTQELEKAKMAAELEARTDSLTGVHNRRSFFAEARKCLNFALRKQQPLSLLMFDIDHFKSINDTYGHAMGDESLRLFSQTIAKNLRDADVWGRVGGEEFALVLYEDKQATVHTAERLKKEISAIAMDTPCGKLQLTTSVGIAYLEQETDIEALLHKADDALYQAKNQGRDCIVDSDTSSGTDIKATEIAKSQR